MNKDLIQTSDTPKLSFRVRTRIAEYGDERKFAEYQLLMYRGSKLVGYEEGPRRETEARNDALRMARKRIRVLRSRRLYVIGVTRKHIADGEARSCHTCAIAQALWHNQERMGFPKHSFSFEVSPYAMFLEPRGIVLSERYGDEDRRIQAGEMPDLVSGQRGKLVLNESMEHWAMNFDDWAESRYMSLSEWREAHGYSDGERPYRPPPASFVLDLDAMTATTETDDV